jgi:5-formyltetrahydrofolate cyclo-ligase
VTLVFDDKGTARQVVWDRLDREGVARFPLPPHGRIPNFAGARAAALRLFDHPLLGTARRIKVNPDAPQRPLREEALRRGITVLMPTPRLRAGFLCLDPDRIPAEKTREAASLAKCHRWALEAPLRDLPRLDAIVCGSVAVTRSGRRCGKGEGYSDLEFAILRELGHPSVPVATTVHPLQIVDAVPRDPTDLPLRVIATPDELLEVPDPPNPPEGIDWARLDEKDLLAMPVLAELRRLRERPAGPPASRR